MRSVRFAADADAIDSPGFADSSSRSSNGLELMISSSCLAFCHVIFRQFKLIALIWRHALNKPVWPQYTRLVAHDFKSIVSYIGTPGSMRKPPGIR